MVTARREVGGARGERDKEDQEQIYLDEHTELLNHHNVHLKPI